MTSYNDNMAIINKSHELFTTVTVRIEWNKNYEKIRIFVQFIILHVNTFTKNIGHIFFGGDLITMIIFK